MTLEKDFGIGACGKVRPNRQHLHSFLMPSQLKLSKDDDPVFATDNLVACAWHNTTRIHFVSNVQI